MRHIRWALPLALLTTLALAAPAFADHATHPYRLSNNGRVVRTFEATHHDGWRIQVAVDTHQGYASVSDDTVDALRSVGRVTKGLGAKRVQVELLRLGDTEDGGAAAGGGTIQTDINILNQHALVPAAPLNSGSTRTSVTGYSDWAEVGAAGSVPVCDPGSEIRSRVNVSVRWADNELDRYTLLSEDFDPDC
jgi:hypothetical protein